MARWDAPGHNGEPWTSLYRLEAVVLLLGAVLVLMAVARRILIPYPIFLVIGGLDPRLRARRPAVGLDPEIVFLIFLPPILWAAAYFTSLRDFQANIRPITLLAVGLVLATTAGVAAVAHAIVPGLGWPAAFVLGAIVSPPDAVAATAIARRLRIPHRVVTILEGESLVNDAAALVLYRAARHRGGDRHVRAEGDPLAVRPGGRGRRGHRLAVGYVTREALHHAEDSLVETAITLSVPYAAWILAERMHASAVLACVAGGLYVGRGFSTAVAPTTRIQARAVWDLLVFVLNGVIFVLIGLQLRAIRDAGLRESPGAAAHVRCRDQRGGDRDSPRLGAARRGDPAARSARRSVVAIRCRRGPGVPAGVDRHARHRLPRRGPRAPAHDGAGAPFPFRDEIIVITFQAILVTLVLQGLTLSPLIRRLRLRDDTTLELEEAHARQEAGRAALARLDDLASRPDAPPEDIERMRTFYTQRVQRASVDRPGGGRGVRPRPGRPAAAPARDALRGAHARSSRCGTPGAISDDVLHRLEQELDIEAMRIGLGEERLPGHSHG